MANTFEQWWEENYSTMVFDGLAFTKSIAEKAWKAARGEDKPKEPEKRPYTLELMYKLYHRRHSTSQDLGIGQYTSKDEAFKSAKEKGLAFLEQFKPSELETWDVRVRPARS